MSAPQLSAILCTHNPRADSLARTYAALATQTLPQGAWELIVVDNASSPPLASPPLPGGRVVVETRLGLTAARLRGIRESVGELLVFVDDDNVLADDYLERALGIAGEWPLLGAWGGQTIAEYEQAPPAWAEPWLWLAVREFTGDRWSNVPFVAEATPFGAGLCVRRRVAEEYARLVETDPLRRSLDRAGTALLGCGDSDLVLTAFDLGLGSGIFARLRLRHLIDRRRVEESYLLKLVHGTAYSETMLKILRGRPVFRPSRSQRLLHAYELLRLPRQARRFERAIRRGREAAIRDAGKLSADGK